VISTTGEAEKAQGTKNGVLKSGEVVVEDMAGIRFADEVGHLGTGPLVSLAPPRGGRNAEVTIVVFLRADIMVAATGRGPHYQQGPEEGGRVLNRQAAAGRQGGDGRAVTIDQKELGVAVVAVPALVDLL